MTRSNARRWLFAGVVFALVLLMLIAALFALYARGGGPLPAFIEPLAKKAAPPPDPLSRSDGAHSVLRTLRLAGVDHAIAGDSGGTAVVRLEVPVASAADVELAWETAFAALAPAYPDARRYVVQVFATPDATASAAVPAAQTAPAPVALVEADAPGPAVRSAVSAGDAQALRRAATFRYLSRSQASR